MKTLQYICFQTNVRQHIALTINYSEICRIIFDKIWWFLLLFMNIWGTHDFCFFTWQPRATETVTKVLKYILIVNKKSIVSPRTTILPFVVKLTSENKAMPSSSGSSISQTWYNSKVGDNSKVGAGAGPAYYLAKMFLKTA